VAHSRLLRRFEELSFDSAVAVRDELGQVSFAELAVQARSLARRLVAEGLAGQRLALLAPPNRSWLQAFWAILLAEGSVVPLSPLHPLREQEFFLSESRARALLVTEPLVGASPAHRQILFSPGSTSEPGAGQRASSGIGATASESEMAAAERAIALILYTSGTTGKPKGVPLSHQNLFDGAGTLREAWELRASDRVLHTLPLHHVHGICVSLLTAFLSGASTEMLPRYEPERVLEASGRASVLMGVPTQHQKLVSYFDALPEEPLRERYREQLHALRLITSGSAPLPEKLGRRMQELCGSYPLERYGMTEVGIVLGNPLRGPRVPGSCGQPLPRCQIRIVDADGKDVEHGHSGEVWIAAPSVFAGYDGDAEATRAAFSDGFFKSGDIALWLDDGFVKLLGRSSVDIIKSGGYKLSALELEEHLREHPWVSEVAVVGVPDETWGERVLAVVVPSASFDLASDHALACEAVRDWMKQRVAPYKVPKQVLFRARLPRNAMGKTVKTALLAELSKA
jgi:malonyl-CoA/methylmalonyl-CoA synthetase